nr:hypothetical protein [Methanothermococcus thermolithotrophicus]
MNLWGYLKGFAAVAMLCMIGAVFATPAAASGISKLSDENMGLYYYQLYKEGAITKDQYDEAMKCWEGVLVLSGVCLAIPGLQEAGVAGSVSYVVGSW